MKKYFAFILSLLLVISITVPAYAITFDITPFEESGKYSITFDDMDDTGEITPADSSAIIGLPDGDDEGALLLSYDIKMIEDMPPVIRLAFLYRGEEWVFTDKIIIKPAETRYTFDVNIDTDVSDGKIYETFVICLTEESIQMLKDIVENEVSIVRCRLDGDRDVDISLIFTEDERGYLKDFYTHYEESGALSNDFSLIKTIYPCAIK